MGRRTCSNQDPDCGCTDTCAFMTTKKAPGESQWQKDGWKHDPKYLYEIRDKLWKVNSDSSIDIETIDDLLTIFENDTGAKMAFLCC